MHRVAGVAGCLSLPRFHFISFFLLSFSLPLSIAVDAQERGRFFFSLLQIPRREGDLFLFFHRLQITSIKVSRFKENGFSASFPARARYRSPPFFKSRSRVLPPFSANCSARARYRPPPLFLRAGYRSPPLFLEQNTFLVMHACISYEEEDTGPFLVMHACMPA
jgi:hypothetical protein